MPDTLPLPIKRKGFTPRNVAAVFIKYDARCAKCSEKVKLGEYQIDHIQRIDALGKHELENWQLLCTPCHSGKTKVDNREAKKGARVRGEKGQRARREKRDTPLILSRGFSRPSSDPAKILSAGWPAKGARKLQSRGFAKVKP